MNLPLFHLPVKKHEDDSPKETVTSQEHPHYTNEGSEFLDDAIRIKDQPLTYTEEAVAPGCPENLL